MCGKTAKAQGDEEAATVNQRTTLAAILYQVIQFIIENKYSALPQSIKVKIINSRTTIETR